MQIQESLSFLLAFFSWAVLHSLTASLSFKSLVRGVLGQRAYDGLYRLFYNGLAVLSFAPVLLLAAAGLPTGELWRIPWPFSLVFYLLQGIGMAGLVVSLLQTDLLRFAGLGQAIRYLQGEAEVNPPPRLVTGGTYALVRHPLYFFSLLLLWFVPLMTWSILIFNVAATLYFWLGSIVEERKLAAVFGESYQAYRRRVPALLPVKLWFT